MATAFVLSLSLPAHSAGGDSLTLAQWYKWPAGERRAEVARIIQNINAKPGCRIKQTSDYYYRAVNAMAADGGEASRLQLTAALALIGTAVEGDWCPGVR